MQKLHIFVVKENGRLKLGLVRNPHHLGDLLAKTSQQQYLISKPYVSTEAYTLLKHWQSKFRGKLGFLWRYIGLWQEQFCAAQDLIAPDGGLLEDVMQVLQSLLRGRLLSEHQIFSILRRKGFWPATLSRALDFGVQRGDLIQYPGFQQRAWGSMVCTRCLSEQVIYRPCLNCGSQECLFCLSCATMGNNRGCNVYLTSANTPDLHASSSVRLSLGVQLTKAQEEAAQGLLEFGRASQARALVWAACGAGKTEVTFPLIHSALAQGQEVLFAIPRQDIVREMAGRLRRAFPQKAVAVHYGGQPKVAPGQLVVATTHQVLYFYRRFHLAILDEVDAFPYQGSEILRSGLQRALRTDGKLVEMTATPLSTKGYQRVITIPARYHGCPLPEPSFVLGPLPNWKELRHQGVPTFVRDVLSGGEQPWLVFVPTIAACAGVHSVLEDLLDKPIGICHSQEPQRIKTVQRFVSGEINTLVTTSVLERGVNFPGISVIVLYADHELFTTSALVQMAGRVGRSAIKPHGSVFFVSARRSEAMKKTKGLIRQLNEEARSRGLLHGELA